MTKKKIESNAEKLFNEGLSPKHITLDTFITLWNAISISSIKHRFKLVAGLSRKELEEIETYMSKTIRRLFGIQNYASNVMLWKLVKTSPLKQLCTR